MSVVKGGGRGRRGRPPRGGTGVPQDPHPQARRGRRVATAVHSVQQSARLGAGLHVEDRGVDGGQNRGRKQFRFLPRYKRGDEFKKSLRDQYLEG